ncbi:MAG: hypothetical protein JSV99_05565 [Planctomycetota bacterium]|nr:MAG: hypothetical protein JSV99_05565 [Planctomycetota bacterium]
MKEKTILLSIVVLLSTAGFTQAQEAELSGTFEMKYLSEHIWRGFHLYGSQGAFQTSLDLDLYGTGFGFSIGWSRPVGSGAENLEWIPITLYYKSTMFEAESHATDYQIGWRYYNFPDSSYTDFDMQEMFASLSWPNILPAGIVPSYTIVVVWPSSSASLVSETGGWLHILGIDYAWAMQGLTDEMSEQVLNLHAELVYNDGFGSSFLRDGVVGGPRVDHDWSHFVIGASTDFEIAENLTFTPGLYHQLSMEDSVDEGSETWVTLSMKYKF